MNLKKVSFVWHLLQESESFELIHLCWPCSVFTSKSITSDIRGRKWHSWRTFSPSAHHDPLSWHLWPAGIRFSIIHVVAQSYLVVWIVEAAVTVSCLRFSIIHVVLPSAGSGVAAVTVSCLRIVTANQPLLVVPLVIPQLTSSSSSSVHTVAKLWNKGHFHVELLQKKKSSACGLIS